jgi:hypothetical protein
VFRFKDPLKRKTKTTPLNKMIASTTELCDAITTTQLFSRAALGTLWENRAEFDKSTVAILNALYLNRKKGSLQGQQEITYQLSKSRAGQLGFGRLYGSKSSLERLQNECRATLCKDLYYDIDIVNAQPTMLLQLVKRELGVHLTELAAYVENRDVILKNIMESEGINRDQAKEAVISVLYGGSTRNPLLIPLAIEVRTISKQLAELPQYIKLFDSLKNEDKHHGSFLAYLTQDAEKYCMLAMRAYLMSAGWSVDILAYDGVMIRCRNGYSVDNALLTGIERAIWERTGYHVRVLEKEMQGFVFPADPGVDEKLLPSDILVNDLYACRELVRLLGTDITKQDDTIYIYNPDNGLWEQQGRDGLCGLGAVHRFADQLIFRQEVEGKLRLFDYGGDTKKIRNMLAHLPKLVGNTNFIRENTKASKCCLLFQDGIYDMRVGVFTAGFDRGKVFTARVGRAFPRERDEAVIADVNRSLFVNPFSDVAVGEWYKNRLARALAGHTEDKAFYCLLGEPNTGKSTVTTLLTHTFDGYVRTWVLDNLKYKAGSTVDEAKRLSWVADLLGARIAISNEARMDGVALDGNLTKRLSGGGDAITLRQNFRDETTHELMTTFVAMANDMPAFSPCDAALRSRMNFARFNYSFVQKAAADCSEWERPADPLLKDKIESAAWKDAFTWIILDAYRGGSVVAAPAVVEKETEAYIPVEASSIRQILEEEFEFVKEPGETDWVAARDIISVVKAAGINLSVTKIGMELKKLGLNNIDKKVKGKTIKVWIGLRR